jgi:hypothetical protein
MKSCKKCQNNFTVSKKDEEFLNRVSPEFGGKTQTIPHPTLCPGCRQQRRLTWRNERNLYQRTCDLCQKKSLSIYREDSAFPVYCLDCWWSDKWDPQKYAKDFDFTRPFFQQFKDLQDQVPRMMVQQLKNENSQYTANVSHLKNCYLLFSSDFNKDCYYGVWIENCQDSLDNLIINKCQLTHEAIFSDNIYNCTFVIHSTQCSDSAFLLDCKNCSHCFMCYGLRNKKYCIANKQYSEEEYLEQINSKPLSSHNNYQSFKEHYFDMIKDANYLFMWRNGRIEDSSGDFLTDVKNCHECFEVMEGRDCKYVQGGYQITDAQDCSYVNGELGYENCECFPMPMKSAFNINSYSGNDLYYSDMCMNNNSNLFGCIGLKKSKNCILNKQYSPEEYAEMATKIIDHMEQGGEYGEFPPSSLSPFHYSETNAQEFFPMEKEERAAKKKETQSYEIADDINDVSEDILKNALACEKCSKNYKIISQEYELLQKLNLPIPRLCFECRHTQRSLFRKERKLFERKCHKCSTNIQTNYSPTAPQKVYCEACYMQEVY